MAPPRTAFTDYRLGHTAGKPCDRQDQRDVVGAALSLIETATEPGQIVALDKTWSEDQSWRESPLSGGGASSDGRAPRSPVPVYQTEADRLLAEARHTAPSGCPACVGADLHPAGP